MVLKKSFWEDTYQQNIKKLIGICFRYVSDRQIAEDLAHDSFLKAMHKSDTFKGKGHFEAWLRRITVNTALQHLRDEKVKNENRRELGYQDSINNDGDMNRWQDFTVQELLKTITQLPEHHRLVFNLYVIDKFSHKQIAEKLNISEGTSKSHLARARKKLQLILNGKLKEKEKKNKRSFIFIIFPFGFGKIDRLYRNRFYNYEIKPQSASFFDSFDWSYINQPRFNTFYNSTIATTVVGLSIILIAIYVFNKKNESKFTKEENTSIDTVLKPKDIDTVIKNTDTVLEIKTPNKQAPIVIKKKRVVHKNLIIRDTLTIINTTNAK